MKRKDDSVLISVFLYRLPHLEAAGGPPGRGHGGLPHGGGRSGHMDCIQLRLNSAPLPH